jgi:hypothetical protein
LAVLNTFGYSKFRFTWVLLFIAKTVDLLVFFTAAVAWFDVVIVDVRE